VLGRAVPLRRAAAIARSDEHHELFGCARPCARQRAVWQLAGGVALMVVLVVKDDSHTVNTS
jgi:hypothetical protein